MAAGVAGCGASAPRDTTSGEVRQNLRTVAGVEQQNITLGNPKAPATLTVYVSLDAFNRGFFADDLPRIVSQWVRPGRLRVQVRTTSQSTSGVASDGGARLAARYSQAVGLQNHLWQFYGALTARYTGVVDDALLNRSLAEVQGIDRIRVPADAKTPRIAAAVKRADLLASDAKVWSLPAYVLEAPGRPPAEVDGSCLGCLTKNLTRSLASAPRSSAPGQPAPRSPAPRPPAPRPLAPSRPGTPRVEVRRNLKTVAGVPQDGITLGRLAAPATLTVYASLDDFSRKFFRTDLPRIVSRWVRPGRLRIQIRTTSSLVLGASADRSALAAAKIAQAVGLQNHLWQFYGALSARYRGSIDDALLNAALSDVRGIDPTRMRMDSQSTRISKAIARGDSLARQAKVSKLPTYVLEAPGRAPKQVDGSCAGCLAKNLGALPGVP
ncbi:MAG: hypothetical protein ACR2NB_15450 [Solirubrobacteraceae bacterium]